MAKKDNYYLTYQEEIKSKDKSVNSYIRRMLAITQAMFVYKGLPDSLPQNELEKLLQTNGNVFVTEVAGKMYAFTGGWGGTPDVYNNPTEYIVANPYLNLNKTYKIGIDGILIKNDSGANSLLPIFGKYGVLCSDTLLSLNTCSVLSRITMLISASDDKTKQSADEFITRILNGDFSVIGENAFFKGVNLQSINTQSANQIGQLIELLQYFKASAFNEIGLNANYNLKRERLNTSEVQMNVDALNPYVDNMLQERKKAVDKINEMFGTDISVELGSSWAIRKNETETENKNETETENKNETETENKNETETENKNEENEDTKNNSDSIGENADEQETETEVNYTETDEETDTETDEEKDTETDEETDTETDEEKEKENENN